MIEVVPATSDAQLDQTRALIRAFVAWHRQVHLEDARLIDDYFDHDAFENELRSLPGEYAPPRGSLLLATQDGRPAGCVALRPLDQERCEMKRMFVYPELHGTGIGRALAEAVIQAARRSGYRSMFLDTSFRQVAALKLYRRLGFQPAEPYYDVPAAFLGWLVFLQLPL